MPRVSIGFLTTLFITVMFAIAFGAAIVPAIEGKMEWLPVMGQGLLVLFGFIDCIRTAQGRAPLLVTLLNDLFKFSRTGASLKP